MKVRALGDEGNSDIQECKGRQGEKTRLRQLSGDGSGGFDATIDVVVWIPELRAES